VSPEGGVMTTSDLEGYSAVSTDPVSSTFLGSPSFFARLHSDFSLVAINLVLARHSKGPTFQKLGLGLALV